MPHYRGGMQAELGDIVRGKGYNIKREIEGIVTGIKQGDETCNLTVALLTPDMYGNTPLLLTGSSKNENGHYTSVLAAHVEYEYGQADAFDLVERKSQLSLEIHTITNH